MTSPAPAIVPVAGPAAILADIGRLARASLIVVVLAVGFGAVHAVAAWWLGDPSVAAFAAIHGALALIAALAQRSLREGRTERGLDTLVAGILLTSVAWAVFVPVLRDIAMLGPILALTCSLPYRRGRSFGRVVLASAVTIGVIIAVARVGHAALPSAYLDAVRVPSVVAVMAVIILVLWHCSVALQTSLEHAGDSVALLRTRQQAIDATSSGVLILDVRARDWRIEYVNPAVERITGYRADELIGTDGLMLVGPETDQAVLARHQAMIAGGEDGTVTIQNYRRDGTPFWNELTVSPIREPDGSILRYVVIQTDITPRRALEDQVRHAQRMESVGQLAGGVAHDFNNLLTAIGGYAQLARDQVAELAPAADAADAVDSLDEIGRATDRAARLTRQLLAFGRRQLLEPEILSLGAVVEDVAPMLRRLLGEAYRLEVALDADAPPIYADRGQIEQVIVNLVVNARDAQQYGGPIRIGVSRAEERPSGEDRATPAIFARLRVSDEGTGIPPDVQARMYEPFFTTKSREAGTGLGLATVDGIVAQTGGRIRCRTAREVGTTFEIDLPAAVGEAASAIPAGVGGPAADPAVPVTGAVPVTPAVPVAPATSTSPGGATVLVVEDNPAVRALTATILTGAGYRVLAANGVYEAIDLATAHGPTIDLLLSDVVMPGMRGPELAARLTRDRRLPVVFMSGYTDDALDTGGPALVPKPFTAEQLLAAVRAALDRPADGRPALARTA